MIVIPKPPHGHPPTRCAGSITQRPSTSIIGIVTYVQYPVGWRVRVGRARRVRRVGRVGRVRTVCDVDVDEHRLMKRGLME